MASIEILHKIGQRDVFIGPVLSVQRFGATCVKLTFGAPG